MNEPKETNWAQAVPEAGLTVLFEPKEPTLDIVFIHGFTGHPERTWTSKNSPVRHGNDDRVAGPSVEPPAKMRRLNPFPISRSHNGGTIYWPRDLVPTTVPSARVLTYGYDTRIRHRMQSPVNQNTVYDIAWNLLVALESERRTQPSRPLLFVVHSLGGIVVKEMLRRSKGCRMGEAHLRSIFDSTTGIIFFGTPHAGADPRSFLLRIAERVIKAFGYSVNEHVVNSLLPSSERLAELRSEFIPMAEEQNWIIHSFQEQYGIGILNNEKVVEDTSSYLNARTVEIHEHIGRNHMEMCRFTGFEDSEYKKVAAALCRMTIPRPRNSQRGEGSLLSEQQRKVLLDSLRFDQIDNRWLTIKKAHAKTCTWLLEKSEYLDWLDPSKLDEHRGFIWIRGKPGTGKSMLMKFALANARKMKDKIVLSFFFNARGHDLEKSTLGMYRALLLQLLERFPELQSVFDSLGLSTWNSGYHEWSVESLKALFEQAVQSLGNSSVICFIDALDECNEQQVRDMVSFFGHVGELTTSIGIKFRVCFASRHYPHISITTGLNLILEEQDGHNQDLTSYLDSELKIGHSKLAEQIRADLTEKASGVFMWVVLVVEILNKEHDSGRIHALRRRLHDIPGDLHKLFRDILTRDHHNRGELLLCIQWVLFARQPLRPEQLYYAIMSGIEPDAVSEWNPDEVSAVVIKRFILNSSKGLTEITKSRNLTVQFIHESVKDFLLKENGLREIWSDFGGNFEGVTHERLKQCCLSYMGIDFTTSLDIAGSFPPANTQEAAELRQLANGKFPFLEYATRNVINHADAAEEGGISQLAFLESFQLTDWIKLDNLFERQEVRRHTPKGSFLYILAENNMAALIRVHPSRHLCFDVEDERYGPPLFAALATSSHKAIESFVEVHLRMLPLGSLIQKLCKQFFQNRKKSSKIIHNFIFSRQRSVLSYVIEEEDEAFLAFFVAACQKNALDQLGRGPLSWAAEKGYAAVVQLLLDKGADVNSKDGFLDRTPLSWAAENGHTAIVQLLVDKSAVVDSKDSRYGETPLSRAAERGHEAIVRLLIEKGANINVASNDSVSSRTPLSYAAENGHAAIVRLLIDEGANVDSKDSKSGRTPLSYAAENGYTAIVQLLVNEGAVVDSKDSKSGRTPLWWAAGLGREAIVRLLIDEGANVDSKDSISGRTPLWWAAGAEHEAIVRLLLDKNADIESKDTANQTLLSWVVRGSTTTYNNSLQDYQMQVMLLERQNRQRLLMADPKQAWLGTSIGLDPNIRVAIVTLLLEKGADVESRDTSGRTPLSWAAEKGNQRIIPLLLAKGADIDSRDNSGRTPLSWAAEKRHEAIVRLLSPDGTGPGQ